MTLIKLIICFFFGQFGVHKFMEKKIFLGILYLFTFGLFGIGWFLDLIIYFLDYMEEKRISHESYYKQNISDNTQDTQQKINIEKKL